jgi:hypothetical protein
MKIEIDELGMILLKTEDKLEKRTLKMWLEKEVTREHREVLFDLLRKKGFGVNGIKLTGWYLNDFMLEEDDYSKNQADTY